MGYELTTEFIEKAHETDPRRLYSHTGADWQYRVDFDRLRRERLGEHGNNWKPLIWARSYFSPAPISAM